MKIKVHQIPEEGTTFEGDLPVESLGFGNEPLYRFPNPVSYRLEVSWAGPRSVLARGRVSTMVKAHCVRTLEWFDLAVEVGEFEALEDVQGDEVDLTPHIREDILFNLPANPTSPGSKPFQERAAPPLDQGNEAWDQLDKLKLK
jgi:uncharacterized metal-binding protein YceD (DUF177 family)